jgi:hypothetical protein
MRRVLLLLGFVLVCLVLGFTWMIVQPMLADTGAWPVIEAILSPLPYILAIGVALLFIYAGVFAGPATLAKFKGSLSLLPPSISTPLSRAGFVIAGLFILAIVAFILLIHSPI